MKTPDFIYLQKVEADYLDDYYDEYTGVTWCQDKINDDDIGYIRADIVESEINCAHVDIDGFDKSVFKITLDGAKRLKRIFVEEDARY